MPRLLCNVCIVAVLKHAHTRRFRRAHTGLCSRTQPVRFYKRVDVKQVITGREQSGSCTIVLLPERADLKLRNFDELKHGQRDYVAIELPP